MFRTIRGRTSCWRNENAESGTRVAGRSGRKNDPREGGGLIMCRDRSSSNRAIDFRRFDTYRPMPGKWGIAVLASTTTRIDPLVYVRGKTVMMNDWRNVNAYLHLCAHSIA